ncbi:MAG: hypothetical protein CL663_01170 [Bacteroidetes bacterium]|nr:hypothetical protein [Bacteroidota bacterium]
MIRSFSLQELLKKDAKKICMTIGGFYTFFGIAALLMVRLQSNMMSTFEDPAHDSFNTMMSLMHESWNTHMPFLALLGIAYLAFGYFFNKIKMDKLKINLILGSLCLIWTISYPFSITQYIDLFANFGGEEFEAFKYISYVFGAFGFAVVLALMTVPQFFIGKKIKQREMMND